MVARQRRSKAARQFGVLYEQVSEDIYKFCQAMNFEATHQQSQLLDAVQLASIGKGDTRIAVKSGQGPGKTTTSALVGMWLSLIDPFSKVVVTAPTMRQCKDVWLAECKQLMRRADPRLAELFKFTGTGYGVCGYPKDEWGCLLITATKAENAQGQHRKDMHLIEEEASGISREIDEQFKGTMSNPNAIVLKIGNPNTRDCAFFDCFHSLREMWDCFTWNAEETPASEWFDPARNKQIEEEYGRDSDVYRVRILGEFPHADPNCVLSSEEVQAVMDRRLMVPASKIVRPTGEQIRQFGIDLARFGGDENVIMRRKGNAILEWTFAAHQDPNDTVDQAFEMQDRAGWSDRDTIYVFDAGGIGQGVAGNFHRARKRVVEFHFGGRSGKRDYENKITRAWFQMAKVIRGEGPCYIPFDHRLLQQLSTRQYFTTRKGKLVLETKDEYMKRGHDSPDRADGCVLAFWEQHAGEGRVETRDGSGREVGDL